MFKSIEPTDLPKYALLARYQHGEDSKGYTDCFTIKLLQRIELANFVEAFYTSSLFKVERWILMMIGKSSNDKKARELALGLRTDFAAWTVEDRNENQILLCDFMKKTRSWLMVEFSEEKDQCKLYFGSAVVFKSSESNQVKPPTPIAAAKTTDLFRKTFDVSNWIKATTAKVNIDERENVSTDATPAKLIAAITNSLLRVSTRHAKPKAAARAIAIPA